MLQYILRRLIITIPILFGVTIVNFGFINLAPGDPITAMIDPGGSAAIGDMDALRRRLGLDQPLPVRYGIWLRELLAGNMGFSFVNRRPVSELIGERLGATILLTSTAFFISILIGIPLGIISALRQYSLLDYVATLLAFAAISIPEFFLAVVAVYIFAITLDLLPPFGMTSLASELPRFLDYLRHLILPAAVLGTAGAGSLVRFARTSLLEVLDMDYVRTAQSKGLQQRVVVLKHALRNALIPLITVLSLRLPFLFGGSVIIETVFNWPGIGHLLIGAINGRDYPLIMGLLLIIALLVMLANLLADILYAYADPRIRYEESSA